MSELSVRAKEKRIEIKQRLEAKKKATTLKLERIQQEKRRAGIAVRTSLADLLIDTLNTDDHAFIRSLADFSDKRGYLTGRQKGALAAVARKYAPLRLEREYLTSLSRK